MTRVVALKIVLLALGFAFVGLLGAPLWDALLKEKLASNLSSILPLKIILTIAPSSILYDGTWLAAIICWLLDAAIFSVFWLLLSFISLKLSVRCFWWGALFIPLVLWCYIGDIGVSGWSELGALGFVIAFYGVNAKIVLFIIDHTPLKNS